MIVLVLELVLVLDDCGACDGLKSENEDENEKEDEEEEDEDDFGTLLHNLSYRPMNRD